MATDNAGFTREGADNSRNTHIWSDENTSTHFKSIDFKINFQSMFGMASLMTTKINWCTLVGLIKK
jgi:hypothetical protein